MMDHSASIAHSAPLCKLSGLIAAVFTPMHSDGSLNLAAIPAACYFVVGQGVSGLFLCGSTGESPSLSTAERIAVAEEYSRAAQGRVPIVVHVGHNSMADACALAEHAASIDADAIAVVPPSYFPPASAEMLVACLQQIAAAAPKTALYYYHIPRITGVGLRMIDLLERADDALPTLAGIKFSSFELDDLLRCVRHADRRYNILFGSDEMLLAGLAMGAAGAVGSTYNFMGPYYRRVIDAFEAGKLEEAQEHQHLATRIVHEILKYGGHNAIKASMSLLGSDVGPPRLPIAALTPAAMEELKQGLASLGASRRGQSK